MNFYHINTTQNFQKNKHNYTSGASLHLNSFQHNQFRNNAKYPMTGKLLASNNKDKLFTYSYSFKVITTNNNNKHNYFVLPFIQMHQG